MDDTPKAVREHYHSLLMQRSGEERLRMGSSMFDAARALMRASLGDPDGTDDSAEMRVRLFLRTYGRDFDSPTRARIVAWLRQPQRG
jgi:hypothetical protein